MKEKESYHRIGSSITWLLAANHHRNPLELDSESGISYRSSSNGSAIKHYLVKEEMADKVMTGAELNNQRSSVTAAPDTLIEKKKSSS